MSTYRLDVKKPNILTLMFLSAFASMGAVLMMPALPEISAFFNIHSATAQLTVTFFLLGYSVGQLLYGPLANRYGRKFALYVGIAIATIGSLFSILSSPLASFHLLVFGRFLEAVGACAGLSVSVTVINDYYYEVEARRIFGYLMFAFAIIPGIAVMVGGVIVQFLTWQSCFYFMLLYGLVLLIPTILLPETNLLPDMNALKYQHVFKNYVNQFKLRKLVAFSIIPGFSSACIYVFGAEGPFIGIHLLKIEPAVYGFLALTPYLGVLIGSVLSVRTSHLNVYFMLKLAFLLELIGSLLLLILFSVHWISLWTMLIPMGLFCIGHPIIASGGLSFATQQTQDKGNGSAVSNFFAVGVTVILTVMLTVLHTHSPIVLPAILLMGLILMAITYAWGVKS